MNYKTEITSKALSEIESAYRWMADNLGTTSVERWYENLTAKIESLGTFPNRCAIVQEAEGFDAIVRQLRVGKYRVLFSVDEMTVNILSVRHVKQQMFPNENENEADED
jgi:plasmid stabilization system protein ParE